MSKLQTQKKKTIHETADVFSLLASPSRLQILRMLLQYNGDLCVNEISGAVGMTQSATSHQLAKLESSGILECKRMGRIACYRFSKTKEGLFVKRLVKQLV